MKMKKSNKTEQEIQREMEEFSRKVWEFREAQRKAIHDAVDEPDDKNPLTDDYIIDGQH